MISAARALLEWTRQELSEASGVSPSTIADFEKGRNTSMLTENAGKLVAAFANAGVEFTGEDKRRVFPNQRNGGGEIPSELSRATAHSVNVAFLH